MNGRKFTTAIILTGLITMSLCLDLGCAQQVAPTGGPRDSLPPLLVIATPKDSVLNFTGNKIVFNFNEYITLDNVHDNLIVSPVPKIEPFTEAHLRTLTIKIKDTLEPNTTYSYNFGKSIKDINEGNVAKNLTYVFSTGPKIDSLELMGRVLMANSGKADSTLIVMLHRNADDSAVIKEKPRYITKLDSSGHFHFQNLPSGTFYLYALKDESGQKKLISKTQVFGFAEKPVTIGRDNALVNLYAYLEKQDDKPVPPKPVVTAKPDKNKEQDKRLKFSNNLMPGNFQDLLGNLEFTFPDALKKFDSTKVQFTDEAFKPITDYTFTEDTSYKKLTLVYKWTENSSYHLIVDRDFAEDSAGKRIPRIDTLNFKTLKETDYGSLHFNFNHFDVSKRPVLQLVQSDEIKFAAPITSKEFSRKLFKPGEYEVRILFDDNGNGVWDPGIFFGKHIQPERVILVPKKLNIKANWDADNTVELQN